MLFLYIYIHFFFYTLCTVLEEEGLNLCKCCLCLWLLFLSQEPAVTSYFSLFVLNAHCIDSEVVLSNTDVWILLVVTHLKWSWMTSFRRHNQAVSIHMPAPRPQRPQHTSGSCDCVNKQVCCVGGGADVLPC